MEKRIIFTLIIFVIFSTTLKSQWTVYQTNTTMALYKIQFINENTGFAAGGESSEGAGFFKTTDAGSSWQRYTMSDTISWNWSTIYGMFFVNENIGFVSGRYLRIFKTTNGGLNWQSVIPPYYSLTQIYNALYFINENTGYAAGRYGYFCKTTNSGLNWILTSDLSSNLYGVYFSNENTGYVCAGDGTVYKTTNGGNNFSQSFVGPYLFESIRFISESTGFVVGHDAYYNSGIYRTTNSGESWENILVYNENLYDVFFVNVNTGYTSGWISILKTTNAGINWTILNKPEDNAFFNLHFFSADYGFMSGGNGRIYKTTTGGVWINQISAEVPEGFKISNCYPNPFNSELKVQIELNTGLIRNSEFVLEVYNTLGKLIINKNINLQFSGKYEIGVSFDEYPSGVYFIRLRSQDIVTNSNKIILLK